MKGLPEIASPASPDGALAAVSWASIKARTFPAKTRSRTWKTVVVVSISSVLISNSPVLVSKQFC
jgi:hypothetical protein